MTARLADSKDRWAAEFFVKSTMTSGAIFDDQGYRTIFDALNDAIFIHDIETGDVVYVNRRALELYKASREQLCSSDATQASHFPPPYTLERAKEYLALAAKGQPQLFEWRAVDWLGESFWVEVSLQRAKIGGVDRILAIVRGIGERKKAEDELLESERRFRNLLETVRLLTVILDDKGRIVFCNEFFLEKLGYKESDVVGKDWFSEIVCEGERIRGREDFDSAITKGSGKINGEVHLLTKSGELREVAWDATALREHSTGRILAVAFIGRDITEQRILEEQLRQSQKMEAIGLLAGGVAHDFNNILTVILGYADLVQQDLPSGTQAHTYLGQILHSGERAQDLTRQLLAFGRKQVLALQVVDVNHVVRNVQKMLSRLIGEDIDLTVGLQAEEGKVKADIAQLELVLVNLAVNARDAMPKGGHLVIRTRSCFISEAEKKRQGELGCGPYVVISVSDTGCGIAPEIAKRIFEPFFTTKEKGHGTGLGLATSYGIVKQHGGNIFFDSKVNQGTTFEIYLPRVEVEPEAHVVGGARLLNEGRNEVVLVVEDDRELRAWLQELLSAHGYRVYLARNGREALDVFGQVGRIDLLIADVIMPEMSGVQLYQELNVREPQLKVLFMSGYSENVTISASQVGGEDVFIQKPFSSRDILAKLRHVLDR